MASLPPNFGATFRNPSSAQATPLQRRLPPPQPQAVPPTGFGQSAAQPPPPVINAPQMAQGAAQMSNAPSEAELGMLQQLFTPAPPGASVDIGGGMVFGPPKDEQEKEQRKQGFKALFEQLTQSPEAQQALLAAAVQILKPIDPSTGETVLNRVAQGGLVGASTFSSLSAESQERETRQKKDELAIEGAEQQLEMNERRQAATEKLIEFTQQRTDLSDDRKRQFELLAQSGELSEALDLVGVDEEARILSEAETREMFGGRLEDNTVVFLKSDGTPSILHTPKETEPNKQAEEARLILPAVKRANPGMSDEAAWDRSVAIATNNFITNVADDGTVVEASQFGGPGQQRHVDLPPVGSGGPSSEFGDDINVAPGGEQIVTPDEALVGQIQDFAQGIPSLFHSIIANIPIFKENLTDKQSATVASRAALNIANRDVIRYRLLSDRNAVTEQKIIEGETPIKPSFLTNPSASRTKLETLDREISIKNAQNQRALDNNDITDLKERNRVRQSIRLGKELQERFGVQRFNNIKDTLETGSARTFQDLTEAEKRFFLITATAKERESLPPSVVFSIRDWVRANSQ